MIPFFQFHLKNVNDPIAFIYIFFSNTYIIVFLLLLLNKYAVHVYTFIFV